MDGYFYLSRNFKLQKVGDLKWLINNFKFHLTSSYVDELIIIQVKKRPSKTDFNFFLDVINKLRKNIFVPISLGGGIRSFSLAQKFFENGADKIILNTSCYEDIKIIDKISDIYGAQAVSISIDYKNENSKTYLFSNSGTKKENINFCNFLNILEKKNCGEIVLNSIDCDGTGQGMDKNILSKVKNNFKKPLLLMGGAGKYEHFKVVLKNSKVSGVITANLFNFLGDGLKKTRENLIKSGINIAKFQ
jgi:imidazole glycerol-phosphate synthase subunit HisF